MCCMFIVCNLFWTCWSSVLLFGSGWSWAHDCLASAFWVQGYRYKPPHSDILCLILCVCCLQINKSIWLLSPGPFLSNFIFSSFSSCGCHVQGQWWTLQLFFWCFGGGYRGQRSSSRSPQPNTGQWRTDSVWFPATEMVPQMVKQYNKGLTFTKLLSWILDI